MNNETIKPTIPEGWTEWVYSDEKPYPETLDTKVKVLFADGEETAGGSDVGFWQEVIGEAPNSWNTNDFNWKIIAYKTWGEV